MTLKRWEPAASFCPSTLLISKVRNAATDERCFMARLAASRIFRAPPDNSLVGVWVSPQVFLADLGAELWRSSKIPMDCDIPPKRFGCARVCCREALAARTMEFLSDWLQDSETPLEGY